MSYPIRVSFLARRPSDDSAKHKRDGGFFIRLPHLLLPLLMVLGCADLAGSFDDLEPAVKCSEFQGETCDPNTNCGCAEDERCLASNNGGAPTCQPRNDGGSASTCESDSQCAAGEICDTEQRCVTCRLPRQVDLCDPVAQCGCGEGQTCVWAEDGALCEKAGTYRIGEQCSAGDCEQGAVCVEGLCRFYCGTTDNCFDRRACQRLNRDLALCSDGCDVDAPGSCGPDMTCAAPGMCVVPAETCPEALQNDGTCDGPLGTGRCARDADDSVDCCAASQNNGVCDGPEGTGICNALDDDMADCCDLSQLGGAPKCDPVTQCGCQSVGGACRVEGPSNSTPGDVWTTACEVPGNRGEGEVCDQPGDCNAGLDCWNGICSAFCDPTRESSCFGGRGRCIAMEEKPGIEVVGICLLPCDYDDPAGCPPERPCGRYAVGNLCGRPQCDERIREDGTCDGPSGTGLCDSDAEDPEDCSGACMPLAAAPGDCNPMTQCGCSGASHCIIGNASGTVVAGCMPSGPTPVGGACENNGSCASPATCVNSVCRSLCNPNGGGPTCNGQCTELEPGLGACITN